MQIEHKKARLLADIIEYYTVKQFMACVSWHPKDNSYEITVYDLDRDDAIAYYAFIDDSQMDYIEEITMHAEIVRDSIAMYEASLS